MGVALLVSNRPVFPGTETDRTGTVVGPIADGRTAVRHRDGLVERLMGALAAVFQVDAPPVVRRFGPLLFTAARWRWPCCQTVHYSHADAAIEPRRLQMRVRCQFSQF